MTINHGNQTNKDHSIMIDNHSNIHMIHRL